MIQNHAREFNEGDPKNSPFEKGKSLPSSSKPKPVRRENIAGA